MKQFRSIVSHHWPIIGLTSIVLVISLVNYVPGTSLTGWDNLHPEFNFLLNIKRSLFSVWEEYQSLGLLAGHAHSTDILRQLSLYALSFIFPTEILRYLSTFTFLLLGTLGAYALIHFLFTKDASVSEQQEYAHNGRRMAQYASFLGALFYLLNLATMQTFYAPFEAFVAHFASLPWLLYGSLAYLMQPSKKHRLLLIASLIFALPAAYIPTLFLVYGIALGLCLLVYFVFFRSRQTLLRIIKLGGYIFLINAFWLLPFMYFTVTNASVNLHSKINQMATETIFLQNKEFGTLGDVMLLKGFWFNNTDPNRDMVFTYMMEPWREHLANPLIAGIGYLLFVFVLIGAIVAVRRKQPVQMMFVALLLFSFTALAIATPPFSWINGLLRESIPLLNQAFRFPYTKFSILAGLTYAVLFAIALHTLENSLSLRAKRSEAWQSLYKRLLLRVAHRNDKMIHILVPIVTILLVIFSFPTFQGHLLYDKERLAIPKEYTELFAFFNDQSHTTRIANLPQHTFWGWNFYSWGYGGSGFLWYGLPQPILDRAFDVWSQPAENYYYELSRAVYTKDPVALRSVLDKYQISWLLLDENIVYPPSPKLLFYEELKQLIATTDDISMVKKFGKITVYKVKGVQNTSQFVYATGKLPSANATEWMSDDLAYRELGNYTTSDNPETRYPFRSLATVKSAAENTVQVAETDSSVILTTPVSVSTQSLILKTPSYAEEEQIVPVLIRSVDTGSQLVIEAVITPPRVTLGSTSIGGVSSSRKLFVVAKSVTFPLKLQVNGDTTIDITAKPKTLITTFFSLREPNILTLTPRIGVSKQININAAELTSLPNLKAETKPVSHKSDSRIELQTLKITDPAFAGTIQAEQFKKVENCDGFRNGSFDTQIINQDRTRQLQFSSDNATACTSYFADTLPHDIGYLLQISGMNQKGRPLHFWVENIDQRRGPIDTSLPADHEVRTNTYFLPPLESFGRSYAFHFDNISIGNEQPVNILKEFTYSPFPYRFASSIELATNPNQQVTRSVLRIPKTIHPNESLYIVSDIPAATETLVLSQAYDTGWKAYAIAKGEEQRAKGIWTALPFLFGKEIQSHVKVNNWENGWVLPPQASALRPTKVIIVYLPQYLQYIGSVITLLSILCVTIASLKWKRKT